MIQSKNKFLPPLYIRKCKITYLECFAILQRLAATGSYFSSSKSMTSHLHATRVRGVRGWAVGRWGRGEQRVGLKPCEVLRMHTTKRRTHIVCMSQQIGTNVEGQRARQAVKPMDASPVPRVSVSVISAEGKRKQKPKPDGNKTVAHSTSCQRKCHSPGT